MKKKNTYNQKVKKLKKECDKLWAEAVRLRAKGYCELCGMEGADAHHIEGRKRLSVRWDLDNGIFLCKSHHTFGWVAAHCTAHSGQQAFHKLLIEKYGSEYLERLAARGLMLKKWKLLELEELKEYLISQT